MNRVLRNHTMCWNSVAQHAEQQRTHVHTCHELTIANITFEYRRVLNGCGGFRGTALPTVFKRVLIRSLAVCYMLCLKKKDCFFCDHMSAVLKKTFFVFRSLIKISLFKALESGCVESQKCDVSCALKDLTVRRLWAMHKLNSDGTLCCPQAAAVDTLHIVRHL